MCRERRCLDSTPLRTVLSHSANRDPTENTVKTDEEPRLKSCRMMAAERLNRCVATKVAYSARTELADDVREVKK